MRVAIYVRVSTAHQVETQTIEQQLERLRCYMQAQGWELPAENIFRDDGYSGASLKRPGLDQLRDRVRNRELDFLVLTAPDRLARNYVHQMLLLEELEQGGCQVTFVDRPMSRDPNEQLLLQIRGAVAEYERTLITERTRRGRQAKLRAGVLLPWTYAPFGYRLHPERPRDPSGVSCDSAEAALVAELFARYLEPQSSLDSVCKQLNRNQVPTPRGGRIWSPSTLRGILRNPVYTGHVYAGRTRYRPSRIRRSATHPLGQPHGTATPMPPETWIHVADVPAIVSQEQFDLVQRKLAANQSFAKRHNTAHPYLLRTLVSCGRCQLACIARTVHDRYHYYLCNGKANPERSRREDKCLSRFIPAEQLDDLVWQDLCLVLTHPEFISDALRRLQQGACLPQELQMRRENLRKGQVSLNHQLERLTDAYLHAVIPLTEYERRRHELEQKIQVLDQQAQALAAQVDRQQEIAGLVTSIQTFCQRVQQGLAQATFEQKRELVLLLVDRVVVTDSDVEIRYVIPTSPASEHVRFCHLRTDYLHDPTPGGILRFARYRAGVRFRFALAPAVSDVRHVTGPLDDIAHVGVVVALVGQKVLLVSWAAHSEMHHQTGHRPLVVLLCATDFDGQWRTPLIHPEVDFGA